MKKAGLFFLVFSLLFPTQVFRVLASEPDTLVNIADVKVYARRSLYYQEDKKVIACDSSLVLPIGLEPLGEVLQRMAPVNLMQYGAQGSLATLSLRGSSSSQTQINWNGFPINSLTSGIADLSQLDAGMFEEILLIPGASGSLYGSGTFGGAINLDNRPVWEKKILTSVGLNGGSFGTLGGNILFQGGTDRFQNKSGFFLHNANNNFPYRDDYKPGDPTEISFHNRYQYIGFIQTFSARLTHGISLQTGFWYQKKRKEFPHVMGTYQPNYQEQRDSSLRVYLILGKRWLRSSLSVRGAWFRDNMWFMDKTSANAPDYSIDSRFRTIRFMSDVYFHHSVGKYWTLDGGFASSTAMAMVTDYDGTIHEYSIDLYAGSKYRHDRWTGSLTMRQNFNPYNNPLPQADAGIRYALQPDRTFLRFNVSTKYRLPTLNDKYWTPGGNPDLCPEHGWGITTGIDHRTNHQRDHHTPWMFRWQSDFFFNLLNDQIRWIPGQGYWYPENMNKVWTYGAENSLQSTWGKNHLTITCQLNYNFTISTVLEESGNKQFHYQNSYVPVHSASGIFRMDFRFLYAGIYENFTGARYTTPDNDPLYKLNPYTITDLVVGGKKNKGNWGMDLRFVVKNLFNTDYQVIHSYPMPGRAYYLKARFTFETKQPIY